MDDRPNQGALGSSDVWRINSTALKINEAFDSARSAARDEALWLSAKCRELLADNDRLRIENEKLRAAISHGNRTPLESKLLEALRQVAAIENQYTGADWEEIEQARTIASAAIISASIAKAEGGSHG
jgi:hypothetical protein